MRGAGRLTIATAVMGVLALIGIPGPAGAALPNTSDPVLALDHLIETSPFAGSSVSVRDNEGNAFIPADNAFWIVSDNDRKAFEIDATTGVLRRVVPQSAFADSQRFGVGGAAGNGRSDDLEALAYDASTDELYAFSGVSGSEPTVYRMTRDGSGELQVDSWQPLGSSADFTGAGWRPTDETLYVVQGSTFHTYDYATNTVGPGFSISGVSKPLGLDFAPDGDMLAVTGSEHLLRVDFASGAVRPGWDLDLGPFGILDSRGVSLVGSRLYVSDGYDFRSSGDPKDHAVFVFDVLDGSGPIAPTASFSTSTTSGDAPLTVTFTDTSSGGPDTWVWDFGDGTGASGPSATHTYTTPGTYTAALTVTNAQGGDSASTTIAVNEPPAPTAPVAAFTSSTSSGPAPLAVDFTDTSTGSPTSWSWDFGDGTGATTPSPAHSYASPGDYTVTLTVANGVGSDSASAAIHVSEAPLGGPAVADSYVSSTRTTKNYGAYTELKLRAPSQEYRPYFQFAVGGLTAPPESATLRLYATNGGPNGGDWYRVADGWSEDAITWANAPTPTGSPVATVGSVSSGSWIDVDVTGAITGNGTYSFAAVSPSTNTVRFASRESSNPPQLVIVPASEPVAPTASFDASTTSGVAPLTVSFTDTSTGVPTSWSWDFGDGSGSTVPSPSHTFTDPGTYTVALTATNDQGSDTATTTVTVDTPPPPVAPTASFDASTTSGVAPLTVSFTDTSTGVPTSWSWDFGDGSGSTVPSPSHTFTDPGTYSVSLTVTNDQGSDTATTTVTVDPAPTVVTLTPVADSYVSVSRSTKNYASYTDLKLLGPSGQYEYHPYLQFSVSGFTGAPSSVVLRLFVTDSGASGGTWYRVADGWTEDGITWDNAPVLTGTPITTVGPVTSGQWIEIDLTGVVTGDGTYSFAASSLETNTVKFSSREGVQAPQLVITR